MLAEDFVSIWQFINDGSLTADAVCAFHPCASTANDDILIYAADDVNGSGEPIDTLHGLRQQVKCTA